MMVNIVIHVILYGMPFELILNKLIDKYEINKLGN